ncbi:MAG: ThuA domain-containing protein [Planctomycetes bacterium]|nr:ThuA domain-containing protein [Planctomycetota bacterium]
MAKKAFSSALAGVLAASILTAGEPDRSPEGIPKHQEDRIRAAAPEKPRVAPAKRRRVLIWSTPPHLMESDPHKGYCVPYGLCAMRILGEKTGAFEPVIGESLALFLPETIRSFDAIVMNNSCGAWITPGDADMEKLKAYGSTKEAVEAVLRRSLLDYVAGGGGIVAYHFAIGANRHWPEFQELLGATFTGHPWNEDVAVLVEEPSHPLLAAFGGKDFRIADEIYQFGPPYDRSELRVLLSLDTERTNMGVKWIGREDNDFAQAWVKTHGKGRVFYGSFGHRTEIWWEPAILRFYLDAIQFAAGDLDAPVAPRDTAPVHRAPGPTPPDVRAAKMKAANVAAPTEGEIRRIEEAAPAAAPAKPAKRRRVLVWGHAWTHTPNPHAEKAIEILARKTGAFEAVISDDPRLLLGDRLPRFDALVLNNIHEPEPFLPANLSALDPAQQAAARAFDKAVKESVIEYVRGGKGVAGIHAATAACQRWPEYGAMIGGLYGGHILQEVPIRLDDPSHPVNACFEGKPFSILDEIYIFREPYSRANLRVIASLDLDRMEDPGKRPDEDYAVSWVRAEGKGRVFYTTLGHVPATYANPLFLRHLLAGIQFAIGDLEGETAPNPK